MILDVATPMCRNLALDGLVHRVIVTRNVAGQPDVYAVDIACGESVHIPYGTQPQYTTRQVTCLGCMEKP